MKKNFSLCIKFFWLIFFLYTISNITINIKKWIKKNFLLFIIIGGLLSCSPLGIHPFISLDINPNSRYITLPLVAAEVPIEGAVLFKLHWYWLTNLPWYWPIISLDIDPLSPLILTHLSSLEKTYFLDSYCFNTLSSSKLQTNY